MVQGDFYLEINFDKVVVDDPSTVVNVVMLWSVERRFIVLWFSFNMKLLCNLWATINLFHSVEQLWCP